MTKQQKITLSASRDIPFNKLLLSQSNVRHIKAGVSIEELAEDIARRTLLASLTVRPVLDENGAETGMFEIPAGGRRYRALELLVKQKRLNRTAPVPCIIRTDGLAEEDSLAENIQRAPLHPLDQFRAFQAMREKGKSEVEIASAFFVSASIVKQRLKLAAVAPSLLGAYAEEEMTLDQLMAFTVNPDHERQEQVWDALQRHYSKQPHEIRRMLTEGAVRASDRRAQYVGLDAYVDAGGAILRDLFQTDDGGWLQDAGLLDLMVTEKLREDAETVQAEGWHWVEVDTDFPYGHTYGMRRMAGEVEPMTDEEAATYDALKTEFEKLEADHADADELPDEVDARLGEIETAMETLQDRPVRFEEDELAIAGAFVSINSSGRLRVERGYVRPEDEPALPSDDQSDGDTADADVDDTDIDPETGAPNDEEDEDDGIKPLSDRLVTELTAHRTLALRDALAGDPHIAFVAALHVLTLKLFYRYGLNSCIEIDPRSAAFSAQAPGLADTPSAQAIEARSENWAKHLPKAPEDLWDVLIDFDSDSRQALFAHCVSLTLNAVHEAYNRRPGALAHADILATALRLDMAAVGWTPTAEAYLSRVTKAQILDAVREAKGDDATDRITGLKKPEMVFAAEELLHGTSWLPEPLRTPGDDATASGADEPAAAETSADSPIDAADMPDAKDAPQVEPVAAE